MAHTADAFGQQAAAKGAARSNADRSRWELDLHGGLSRDGDQTNGTGSIPDTAMLQGTVSASTFAFGNATALFNANRAGAPIVSLDPVLAALASKYTAGAALGVRLQRSIGDHYGIEISGDYLRNNLAFRSVALTGIESTRATYAAALASTLALSGESSTATSETTLSDHELATRTLFTAGLMRTFHPFSQTRPYVVAGGGIMFNQGNSLAATLTTSYQLGTTSQIVGSDAVTIRADTDPHTAVGFVGGGIKRTLSSRLGFRADARLTLYQASLSNVVHTSAKVGTESQNATLPLLTVNALQFGPVVPFTRSPVDAVTFASSGLQPHVAATAGLFLRF